MNQLPEEIKVQYPDIRWKDIIGFRNILAHRCWRVDLDVVWGLFNSGESLEQLKRAVHELIDQSS
ncbi:HepT-like ribonuclease domain-containing protein [Myxosarcina sp. GI1]|uniref:HepT-like ribonuclease domain-containing protein n=1 Tax=Myxosarcina sp. GI1 TaxID=1541065 RepID=UPI00068E4BCE